jgi:3'5'-cyclic nucleotide phosphodiesterase
VLTFNTQGELQTYWLKHKGDRIEAESSVVSEISSVSDGAEVDAAFIAGETDVSAATYNERVQRMIDWNADILAKLLQRIIATRVAVGLKPSSDSDLIAVESQTAQIGNCMQDVVEVIELPKFDEAAYDFDPDSFTVGDKVVQQLRNYVSLISSMYRSNPFHNFEHASHVTMSTVKLLSRIVAPTPELLEEEEEMENRDLHDYTYGITSDPLTQFAVVFSALIHDVDHRGVPNFLLCKEDTTLATVYQSQSVAEQNSIDVAWVLLMDPMFKDFRRAIYTTEDEMQRFRRLVVNSVMATDIFDKELSALRKNRWSKAFSGNASFSDTSRCRKATIVIEHLIQASDVSHTMQHWHVYQKWNERLFREMYSAHDSGRWDIDPTENWYQGELNFFDSYIIPLAKKLKECGVFGVSSDEYLNYAEKNRSEWERKGQEVVASMREKYCRVNSDMMELAKLDEALHNFSSEKKS